MFALFTCIAQTMTTTTTLTVCAVVRRSNVKCSWGRQAKRDEGREREVQTNSTDSQLNVHGFYCVGRRFRRDFARLDFALFAPPPSYSLFIFSSLFPLLFTPSPPCRPTLQCTNSLPQWQVSVSPGLITHNVRVIHSCLMNNSNCNELIQYLFVFNSIICAVCVCDFLAAWLWWD